MGVEASMSENLNASENRKAGVGVKEVEREYLNERTPGKVTMYI